MLVTSAGGDEIFVMDGRPSKNFAMLGFVCRLSSNHVLLLHLVSRSTSRSFGNISQQQQQRVTLFCVTILTNRPFMKLFSFINRQSNVARLFVADARLHCSLSARYSTLATREVSSGCSLCLEHILQKSK